MRSFLKRYALAMVLAAAFSQTVALSQAPEPQTPSSLSTSPAQVRRWANRLLASDPKARATAEAALVKEAARAVPLLRRFLDPQHEDLHAVTFEIIQRIGPPAIPLLVELLRHESDSIRRGAVNELVDLTPQTAGKKKSAQPKALLVGFKDQVDGMATRRQQELDLGPMRPGAYTLELSIADKQGRERKRMQKVVVKAP